jgi:hypothetical protein
MDTGLANSKGIWHHEGETQAEQSHRVMDEMNRKMAKEFVEKNGRAFAAMEGTCLTCYRETELVSVEGTQEFYDQYFIDPELQGEAWEPEPDGFGDVGRYQYHCPEGHITDVWVTSSGDYIA